MTITSHTTGEIRARLSVRRRLVAVLRRHRRSLAVLAPLLVVAGVVHAWGMATFPAWVDDPGTYLAQAWAVAHEHALSPYTYFYDHAPAGWIQLALWSLLTGGFDRYDTAMAFGNECMLLAKLVSCALLYALARRVGLARAWAAVAVLLFALSPLALVYTRWTFLDNLVTPWLLLAFVLVYSPRKSIGAAVGGSLAFAMAALTKETALVALPAFVYALAQNLDARNRAQVLVMSSFSGLLLMGMYPLFAILRGELLPAPGHTSLLGTAGWQLSGRGGSGSVFDAGSAAHGLVQSWLGYDAILLAGGVLAVPVALVERRLRPIVLLVALQALMLLRGGYVPFMHVILVLPLCALLIAAALDRLAGRRVWVAAVAGVAAAAVW
ncbi:MAG: 4-amino-4-deoxy-L-arabinose transferase, partial [Nonomuraea sp.]|nr:4-amino-4-deoxy-L-arabinose transferase [Nonomuraea sp.]